MKNFKTIFKFELDNYFKSKSYMLLTIIIAVIAATLMFIPRIIDSVKGEDDSKDTNKESEVNEEDLRNMAIYNPDGLGDMEMLAGYFTDAKFTECTSAEEVKSLVEKEEAEDLYRAFGKAWRKFPDGWQLYLLSSHTEFERTFGQQADKKRKLYNGMLKCDLFMYGVK